MTEDNSRLRNSTRSLDRISAYLVACSAVCLALLIKLFVDSLGYQPLSPFRFFFLPVVIAAWYGGSRPGFVALFLGAAVNSVLYLQPTRSFYVSGQEELIQLIMFLLEGSLICVLAGALHASKELAQAQRNRAEAATRRFAAQAEALTSAKGQISEAMRFAEAGTRAKTDFLANISHELRTPMNAIIGMTELTLQDEGLPAAAHDNLCVARESAANLMQLVNDLLDFSKMESGKFELTSEPFSLRATMEETFRSLALSAHEKGLELVCHIEDNVPDNLTGDATRFRQVVTNLVGNAIKFTEDGEVCATITLESQQNAMATIRVCIADTGIGIQPTDQAKIFSAFTQADTSTTRQYHGSGLGLTIAAELVAAMGGRIWVESEVGLGSKFNFNARFPVNDDAQPESDKGRTEFSELRGKQVLVVDDNATNRNILKKTLTKWGMCPVVVSSGKEALHVLQDATPEDFPLIVLDALMPGMDGFAVAQHLQNDPELCQATVLMLSSSDRTEFARRSAELGISAYLEKPITQRDLARAVLQALSGMAKPRSTSDKANSLQTEQPPRALKILVAEDTPANQKVVERILQLRGHEVAIAGNGSDAVELADHTRFDVVLMDIQMPKMDGFQATASLRTGYGMQQRKTPAQVPIIAMTAHAMRGDRERCLAAGMNEYLSKPIDARQMINVVENLASGKPAFNTPNNVNGPHAERSTRQMEQVIDVQSTLKRLANDRDLLYDTINMFLEDVDLLIQQTQEAIDSGDLATSRRTAHSIKGLAANFDAHQAMKAAYEVEDASRLEESEALDELMATMITEIDRVKSALREFLASESG